MQPGNFHYLLHTESISCRTVSGAVAPHIHWITSCSSTFMPHSWFLGLGTTGTGDRKCLQMKALSVEHGSHASTGILTWYKLVLLHLPVPSTDGCFSACKWFIHWTSDYFFILLNLFLARGMLPGNFCLTFEENTPSFPRPDVTSAVLVITRRLKEHTGFTEIPGRLRTAHLLGQMTLFFSKLWWWCLMDVTMNASSTFHGIVLLMWFHWIYCF